MMVKNDIYSISDTLGNTYLCNAVSSFKALLFSRFLVRRIQATTSIYSLPLSVLEPDCCWTGKDQPNNQLQSDVLFSCVGVSCGQQQQQQQHQQQLSKLFLVVHAQLSMIQSNG